jgi:tetratricopeptide (TPR) repeat protein
MLAFAHAFAGRIEEAKEHSRKAEAIVGPFVTPTIECEGLTRRALIAWHDGDADGAIEASREQVATAAAAGLVREVAVGAHNAGDACAKIGRYGEAIEWLERSSAAATQIGYDSLIAQNERVLGFVEAWWLDEPRGRDRIVRALEIAEAGAYQWDEFQARHALALVDAKRGERTAARAAFAELERDAERSGHEAAAVEARVAIAAIDRGELPRAAI